MDITSPNLEVAESPVISKYSTGNPIIINNLTSFLFYQSFVTNLSKIYNDIKVSIFQSIIDIPEKSMKNIQKPFYLVVLNLYCNGSKFK